MGCWRKIEEIAPDVVLIDLGNPSRDVLEEYFAVSRAVARPIAMFVDESDEEAIGASIDAGVSVYVVDGLAASRIRSVLDLAVRRFNAFARLQGELAEAQGKLAERDAIDRAKRILMQSKGVTEPEAYAELRRKAMSSNRRIAEIAEAVVTAHDLLGERGMTEHLTIGFLPLVDACLPILAHEHGFAEEEGLALRFQRDVSWATVLDRLLYGHSDAAHLIAPLAIATTLGRGRPAQPLAAPFVLGLNGNAVTMSTELAAQGGRARTSWPIRWARRGAGRGSAGAQGGRAQAAVRRGAPLFEPQLHAALLARGLGHPARRGRRDRHRLAAVRRRRDGSGRDRRRLRRRAVEQRRGRTRGRRDRARHRADLAPRGGEGARLPRPGARSAAAGGRGADPRDAQGRRRISSIRPTGKPTPRSSPGPTMSMPIRR